MTKLPSFLSMSVVFGLLFACDWLSINGQFTPPEWNGSVIIFIPVYDKVIKKNCSQVPNSLQNSSIPANYRVMIRNWRFHSISQWFKLSRNLKVKCFGWQGKKQGSYRYAPGTTAVLRQRVIPLVVEAESVRPVLAQPMEVEPSGSRWSPRCCCIHS